MRRVLSPQKLPRAAIGLRDGAASLSVGFAVLNRPIRAAQELAAQGNEIRTLVAENLFDLVDRFDQAHRNGRDAASLFHCFGEGHLVSWEDRHLRREQATAAQVEEVDIGFDQINDLAGIRDGQSASQVVCRGKSQGEGALCRPKPPNLSHYFLQEAHTVLKGSAVLICPQIRQRRQFRYRRLCKFALRKWLRSWMKMVA